MQVDEPYWKAVSAMNKCPHCYQELMTAGCVNQFCSGKRLNTLEFPMGVPQGSFIISSDNLFKKDEWIEWLDEMGKVMNFGDAITVEQKREAIKRALTASHEILLKLMKEEMTPQQVRKTLVDFYLYGCTTDDNGNVISKKEALGASSD